MYNRVHIWPECSTTQDVSVGPTEEAGSLEAFQLDGQQPQGRPHYPGLDLGSRAPRGRSPGKREREKRDEMGRRTAGIVMAKSAAGVAIVRRILSSTKNFWIRCTPRGEEYYFYCCSYCDRIKV